MKPDTSLLERALRAKPALVALRRRLHERPEVAWNEQGTQAAIEGEMAALGYACRKVAKTGLLARLPGPDDRKAVVLRAELDALPITEETGASYASKNPGVMHACGHDAHMTMVYGAALLLKDHAPDVASRVAFLFQPAEEVPPGGAREVLDEGALGDTNVLAVFGLHVDPRYPAGKLLLRRGPLMAASDRFRVRVIGKGGHGGYPHLTVDPVVAAAQIVLALQTIVSRQVEPVEPAVVSIGRIEGGTADNVIPGHVILSGTIRSHDAEVRRQIPEKIRAISEGVAGAFGATAEVEYLPGHPGLSNDPETIDFVARTLEPVLGAEALVNLPKPIMGGEDFAHYLERFPGAFLRIGVRNESKGCVHPIHSPRFDLDEEALPVGAAALAAVAAGWLADRG